MDKQLAEQAEYERKYGISPIYRQKNASTLAADAVYSYDWETKEPNGANKYLPFNFLQITNLDASSSLDLYVNGDVQPIKNIPASCSITLDADSLPAFRSIALKNVGSTTISANSIEVVAQRTPIKPERMAQDIHRRIYGNKA